MAHVFDVAAYILRKKGSMSAMKLQKLVYYAQAWSLVWDDQPLFEERIEAWANGPVVPDLYNVHRGKFKVTFEDLVPHGDPKALKREQKETVDAVLDFYGDKSPQWLSDLTHAEDPWKIARKGIPDRERSNREISLHTIAEYYGSL